MIDSTGGAGVSWRPSEMGPGDVREVGSWQKADTKSYFCDPSARE
jgi:hypothetical protein